MARKKKKGRKVRVDFRRNRARPRRSDDWTRAYHDADRRERLEDERTAESVRAKGELSRKRTIIIDEGEEDPLVEERLWRAGVVVSVHGLICRVEEPDGAAWQCVVRRVLRTLLIQQRTPVTVGDRVYFSDQSAHHEGQRVGVIERVAERTSTLSRRDRRGREQTIVANADQLLIVASVAQPRLKPHLIDRYLIAAGKGDLRPIIVFNKWDLLGQADLAGKGRASADESEVDFGDGYAGPVMTVPDIVSEFESLGYTCLRTSATTGLGVDVLRDELRDHRTVLSGQSGVGKSSLLNAVQPGLHLEVAAVSEESEKGRHTTTLARQFRLEFGGYVIDTPGVRSFELWNVEPGELEAYFTEFVPLISECRFNDCHHIREEGCAVIAAVEAGRISARRYASYVKILEELAREHAP